MEKRELACRHTLSSRPVPVYEQYSGKFIGGWSARHGWPSTQHNSVLGHCSCPVWLKECHPGKKQLFSRIETLLGRARGIWYASVKRWSMGHSMR